MAAGGKGSGLGALLLSGMGKPAAPPDAQGGGDMDPLGDALGELAQAMQSGDVEGMKTAFRAAVQACEMEPDDGAAEPG